MRPRPTPAQVAAALEFQSIRPPEMSCCWLVHFADHDPVVRRYQLPVPASRVLSEHAAALAAELVDEVAR